MIICLSTNIPLNAAHGLLFGIFIRALVFFYFLDLESKLIFY